MSTILDIVLVEPEIPANTGNIARTCVVLGARLHLIQPLGFEISHKYLKRSAMDYWQRLDWFLYNDLEEFLSDYLGFFLLVSTKAKRLYSEVSVSEHPKVALIFGKETKGLPEDLLRRYSQCCVRLPMRAGERSLNLSNSVAICAYEIQRQWGFVGLN